MKTITRTVFTPGDVIWVIKETEEYVEAVCKECGQSKAEKRWVCLIPVCYTIDIAYVRVDKFGVFLFYAVKEVQYTIDHLDAFKDKRSCQKICDTNNTKEFEKRKNNNL